MQLCQWLIHARYSFKNTASLALEMELWSIGNSSLPGFQRHASLEGHADQSVRISSQTVAVCIITRFNCRSLLSIQQHCRLHQWQQAHDCRSCGHVPRPGRGLPSCPQIWSPGCALMHPCECASTLHMSKVLSRHTGC